MCFYKDVLESFEPQYGVLETDTIEIERTNGSNRINCKIGEEEFTINNPNQHYKNCYWNQNYIGLKCRIYKKDGSNYVKEYNIAKVLKRINDWTYLTEKRIEKVKEELRSMNGIKVDLENSTSGFRIKDLEEILKKKPKKKERKSTTIKPKKPSFSFETISDNGLKIAMSEYAEKQLTGNFPENSILKKIMVDHNATDQENKLFESLLKEIAKRWKI